MKPGAKLLAHLEMMRPYTLFHSGMLGFASALLLSGGDVEPWRLALAFLVPTLGWLAGLYAGDYYDRHLDAASKPHRPVPSGRVGAREAFGFMLGYIAVGYALALLLGAGALLIALLTTGFGIAYSKTFKRHALLGNLDRGLLACFTVLFGAAAAHALGWSWGLLALLGTFFFHDSASNLIGAIRDAEGDREAGYGTVPAVYGVARSVRISGALTLAWLAFAMPLFVYYRERAVPAALFAVAVLLTGLAYFMLLAHGEGGPDRQQALGAHKVMVAERLVLSAAVAAIHGPAPVVLGALAAALALTQTAQLLLRDRYEFGPGRTQS
ncbi:UbiA prenyltransferase [Rubrobacter xylanophilus DSM 9941]|uniref:UbiA prenyltransferase n=1 Tax=Rubrobacter xylanophilus (strain DSM 9941 / JCM 11954 / NBRC 16129 / PRD-1) TaxID=266117 RepID=Q1ASF6_RUBXD|nr:UbiA family prenyltransferase [Rubrobacter xylanophilus]ABG05672.1 UbiA prenyltransferase [Rubrobacter xylanophilus DSM 9941]